MALKTVIVEMLADTRSMVSGLKRTDKQVNHVARSFRRLGVTLAGIFGARALFRTFNKTLLDADTLVQTARAAGVAASEYERLGFAFEAARVPVDQLRQGLGDLQLRLGDVSRNYDQYYRKIGLDPNQLRKQSPAQQLIQTVSALGKIENQARRVGLAGRVLGEESSRQLIKLISDGGEAFEQSLKQFDRYGSALQDPANVRAIREFSFETLKLQRQWEVLKQRVVVGMLPEFQRLLKGLDESGALDQLAKDILVITQAFAGAIRKAAEFRAEFEKGLYAEIMTGMTWEERARQGQIPTKEGREIDWRLGPPGRLVPENTQMQPGTAQYEIFLNYYGYDANDKQKLEAATERGVRTGMDRAARGPQ